LGEQRRRIDEKRNDEAKCSPVLLPGFGRALPYGEAFSFEQKARVTSVTFRRAGRDPGLTRLCFDQHSTPTDPPARGYFEW